jgi:hypothetical protein
LNLDELERVLETVHELLDAEGMAEAAGLVRAYPARVDQVGYDNWNGGTEIWEIQFEVPPTEFVRLGARRDQIAEQVTARLKTVLEPETKDWYSAKIVPKKIYNKDWRADSSDLPRETRRGIVDRLRVTSTSWNGGLDEVEFLSRLYDLQSLPSQDRRFRDASQDIWQHCINNDDWDAYWVFSDSRFGLADGTAEAFLRFMCETVHPVVRPDRAAAIQMVAGYNDELRESGWQLHEVEKVGGRPYFSYRRINHQGARAVSRARTVADALDAGWMAKAIERLERSVEADPELAIGTAKDLVESCCKTVLAKRGVEVSKAADLGDLTKALVKELQLVPEGVSEGVKGAENIRLILRNLTQLAHNLAQLRGLYGSGHGRDGRHRGLQPRHARLAVASAVAFIDFVTETYRQREETPDKTT